MGEMQRNPAMRADILRGVIRDPGAEREMEQHIAQINEATSAIEKLNLVRQLGEDIEKNALKRGETPERAAGERRMLEERLGYSPQLRMAGQLQDLTEEQRKAEEARTKNMENYAISWAELTSSGKRSISHKPFRVFGKWRHGEGRAHPSGCGEWN